MTKLDSLLARLPAETSAQIREAMAEDAAPRIVRSPEDTKAMFALGAETIEAWNANGHLGCSDWRTRGEVVNGIERCFLASLSGGRDIPEHEWNEVSK